MTNKTNYHYKQITDPIHGTVGLSKLETEILSTRTFQRLHNVRQLGLAHLVFPGAGYSRFAHSVGACFNAGALLDAIQRNSRQEISDERIAAYRLAALLHDIGHYPFSHATEHLIKKYYSDRHAQTALLEQTSPEKAGIGAAVVGTASPSTPVVGKDITAYDHEDLGKVILEFDNEIMGVFEANDFDPGALKVVFDKKTPDALVGIISSDLDCDRLDYLRRTAHNSGAPYGSVDIGYIISQANIDADGRYCFNHKALRAADHLLVSRYYDYMQVPFNKTVVGIEWSLVSCIKELLDMGLLELSAHHAEIMVKDGSWSQFDDQKMVGLFREMSKSLVGANKENAPVLRDHLSCLINRRPPKMVCGWEGIDKKEGRRHHDTLVSTIKSAAIAVSEEFGIDKDRLHVWTMALPITKIGGKGIYHFDPKNGKNKQADDYESNNAVRIMHRNGGEPRIISMYPETLMSSLSEMEYTGVRVFFLPENGVDDPSLRSKLLSRFEEIAGQSATVC